MTVARTAQRKGVEWQLASAAVGYADALGAMDARAAGIRNGTARELVWLLEHPALYTAGTSAQPDELIDHRFPVFASGRGGRYTYHGPGQRVGYVLLDLTTRGRDVRRYVAALEGWIVVALAGLGVTAFVVPGRIGVWVKDGHGEAKIAAIGVRIRQWVTMHGFAINVAPDLTHFQGIVPCGLADFPVTSLAALGVDASLEQLDALLRATFDEFFVLREAA